MNWSKLTATENERRKKRKRIATNHAEKSLLNPVRRRKTYVRRETYKMEGRGKKKSREKASANSRKEVRCVIRAVCQMWREEGGEETERKRVGSRAKQRAGKSMILCFRWYIRRQPETSHLKAGFSATTRIILSPHERRGALFWQAEPGQRRQRRVYRLSREWQREAFSGRKKKKISWKSWKQILVEHWTSHYFSLCLQMLLATVSSAKGQNKGACHRTTQPNPTPPPTSPLPLNRLNVHLLPFFRSSSFTSNAPPLSPATLYHSPTRSSISSSPLPLFLFDYFRFAFLSFSSVPSSLSLSFYARVLITGSRTG